MARHARGNRSCPGPAGQLPRQIDSGCACRGSRRRGPVTGGRKSGSRRNCGKPAAWTSGALLHPGAPLGRVSVRSYWSRRLILAFRMAGWSTTGPSHLGKGLTPEDPVTVQERTLVPRYTVSSGAAARLAGPPMASPCIAESIHPPLVFGGEALHRLGPWRRGVYPGRDCRGIRCGRRPDPYKLKTFSRWVLLTPANRPVVKG